MNEKRMTNEKSLKDKLRLPLPKIFVDALEEFCEQYSVPFELLAGNIYDAMEHMYDIEDVKMWLTELSDNEYLANNEGFVNYFAVEYRKTYNADVSQWDNMLRTFENIKQEAFDTFCSQLNLNYEEEQKGV